MYNNDNILGSSYKYGYSQEVVRHSTPGQTAEASKATLINEAGCTVPIETM